MINDEESLKQQLEMAVALLKVREETIDRYKKALEKIVNTSGGCPGHDSQEEADQCRCCDNDEACQIAKEALK